MYLPDNQAVLWNGRKLLFLAAELVALEFIGGIGYLNISCYRLTNINILGVVAMVEP